MSGVHDLHADAARFDDASLEHLANKGLVRRARKLLDGADVELVDAESAATVSGDGWSVEFAVGEPLQTARCDCSTAGICQHMVASIMVLRDRGEASPSDTTEETDAPTPVAAADIERFLLALTDAELLAFTKTADARWAASRAEALVPEEVFVDRDAYVAVELPTPHPSVRFMGDSLDQAIVKPSGRNDRRAVGLAVLALWKLEGRSFTAPASSKTAPINELVEERSDVLVRTSKLAEDFLAMGLLHVADPEAERIGSLSSSLRGVKLYRMAALAERAADQVDALADLSANADTARLLDQLAELAALAEATSERMSSGVALPEGLVGTARAQYEDVGHLELLGLGDYAWGNARFSGTTTVVAESASRIYSVHCTTKANGRAITNASQWSGVGSVPAVTGSTFTLANAHASSNARLSSSDKSTATLSRRLEESDLAAIAWTGTAPAVGSRLLGSTTSTWAVCPVDDVITPATFDPIDQELVWQITSAGQPVTVRLPFRQDSHAVDHLEQFAGEAPSGILRRGPKPISHVVGRLRGSVGTGLDLWPISVMSGGTLRNLADVPTSATGHTGSSPDAPVVETVTELERLSVELTRLAEGGRRAITDDALAALSRRAEQAGFDVVSKVIAAGPSPTMSVLRTAWLLQLALDSGS